MHIYFMNIWHHIFSSKIIWYMLRCKNNFYSSKALRLPGSPCLEQIWEPLHQYMGIKQNFDFPSSFISKHLFIICFENYCLDSSFTSTLAFLKFFNYLHQCFYSDLIYQFIFGLLCKFHCSLANCFVMSYK